MSERFLYDVFISYSSKDRELVRDLVGKLRADRIRVWFDEDEIKPGDSIPSKIDDGLEFARVLVLCMSEHTFGSDWTRFESNTFRFRDPLNKARRFVPLRLDSAPIRGALAQLKYVDWRPSTRAAEYSMLLEACRAPVTDHDAASSRSGWLEHAFSLGNAGAVRAITVSPDGNKLVSGSADNTLRVWSVNSGRCERVLEGHSDKVLCVTWSADGRRVLSGSADSTLRVWDVQSGQCECVLVGHTNLVSSAVWSADGRRALSGSADKTLRVWDVQSGRCERVQPGHADRVLSVAWSADGRHALSASDDERLWVWDLRVGRCVRVIEGHASSVWSVVLSADGRFALSGSADKTLRVWDMLSGHCERVLEGHTDAVWSVAWSADGRFALSGSADNSVRIWDVQRGSCTHVLAGHSDGVRSVGWGAGGRRALSGSDDNTVRVWDLQRGMFEHVLEGHADVVLATTWSADGRRLLSGSADKTLRAWDVQSGLCEGILEGHTDSVLSLAWSADGRRALSGSADETLRVWDVPSGRCDRVLEGHTGHVTSLALRADGRVVLSGSADNTVRVWDVKSGRCQQVLRGHTDTVWSVAPSADGRFALSGADDNTLRVWNLQDRQCVSVLKGHSGRVCCLAWSSDGRLALSGSADNTLRVWDVQNSVCERVLEGHTGSVVSLAWSSDGRRAVSGSTDKTLRVWDVQSGLCECVLKGHTSSVTTVSWSADGRRAFSTAANNVSYVWVLDGSQASPLRPTEPSTFAPTDDENVEYTNAKVLVVGDTHSGKTALTHRLATGEWRTSEASTVGAWSTQWKLEVVAAEHGVDREIWLWDFGGQADQRLIHQLYMDGAATMLLLFDADQEDVLPGLRDWQTAIARCVPAEIPRLLVAGRIDAGFRASREKLRAFAKEQRFVYYETSAKEGTNCDQLRRDVIASIPWMHIEKRTSPRIFKRIKDEILKLRDEGQVLHTFKELRALLSLRLLDEPRFSDATLQAVIGLLDGPGVAKQLDYGTYVLLAPEWINVYAQAVLRTLRSAEHELGALPLRSIAEGRLIYQSIGRDGQTIETTRLPAAEERVVLGEMERLLRERGLCLVQGDKLVFPSHCGRDRPIVAEHPSVFVSYAVRGYLDDLYATLVVKLAGCEAFELHEVWRDSADFVTLTARRHMGVKLVRQSAVEGEISVYFGEGVSSEEQVIFAQYIHSHLQQAGETSQRLRHYVCPHCNEPKENSRALMKRLLVRGEVADTECDACGERFELWDDMERKFASPMLRAQIEAMQDAYAAQLDVRRKNKLLVLEVMARLTNADQKCFEVPGNEDEGTELQVELTDEQGEGSGRRLHLYLKAGNGHLVRRKDGAEIFAIKDQRWMRSWLAQPDPVMLVVGTFPEDDGRRGAKKPDIDVRWMEIGSVLRAQSDSGTRPVKELKFVGERLDMNSVGAWRQKVLTEKPGVR